jgi:hypothetical protein
MKSFSELDKFFLNFQISNDPLVFANNGFPTFDTLTATGWLYIAKCQNLFSLY